MAAFVRVFGVAFLAMASSSPESGANISFMGRHSEHGGKASGGLGLPGS